DSGTYSSSGSVTFDDWGYTGPGGRTAMDFNSINGFGGTAEGNMLDPTGGIGQIQHVVTSGPDGLTPDAPDTVEGDILGNAGNTFTNANMDSAANFYKWAYTSPANSTFNNMRIDYDGDYDIAKDDMNFAFYNYFDYSQVGTTGGLADGRYLTGLAFQPYALTDATGWCGSVLADHPNALEAMAGQVQFDFAFDVYFQFVLPDGSVSYSYSSTEIVPDFQMRSYGDITVDVTTDGGDSQQFSARAVVNNTDPAAGNTQVGPDAPVDADYHNKVSFMGAGVLPNTPECGLLTAEWASGARGPGVKKFAGIIDGVADATACAAAGGSWQTHAFSGYAFILRADADRYVDYFDESVYGADPTAVPVPAAIWLFGSGLMAMIGFARRRQS
ncbi:MAG: VPLPA-CTERM sorting domain-containing protein, partial [Gammaproteobacteria bacterium]|nr:VPLPA-CTERM sorting domain-containing protein [Gammaproteobacteria bacterium]